MGNKMIQRWSWLHTQTLHPLGYIGTCDVESIFTCHSLARRACSSTALFGTEALARRLGRFERLRLVWQVAAAV